MSHAWHLKYKALITTPLDELLICLSILSYVVVKFKLLDILKFKEPVIEIEHCT